MCSSYRDIFVHIRRGHDDQSIRLRLLLGAL